MLTNGRAPFGPLDPANTDSATDRWIAAVAAVRRAGHDVPTVDDWASLIGVSRRSLYRLCAVVGVAPKASLNLARLARTLAARAADWRPEQSLNADLRTVFALLDTTGLRPYHRKPVPTVDDLVSGVAWPLRPDVRAALARRLES